MDGDVGVRAGYDAWAATYDRDPNRTRDLDAAVLRAQPLPLAGARVVEIGCGTGKNTQWLARHARSVVALDFSEAMLAVARGRTYGCEVCFAVADVRWRWPVDDAAADVVVGNLVLEHVADLAPVFAQAHRVLRDGGTLFICEFHPFRQMLGKQARFATGEREVAIDAFAHDAGDFVNAPLALGLRLTALHDWRDDDAGAGAVPRLLSLTFVKDGRLG